MEYVGKYQRDMGHLEIIMARPDVIELARKINRVFKPQFTHHSLSISMYMLFCEINDLIRQEPRRSNLDVKAKFENVLGDKT